MEVRMQQVSFRHSFQLLSPSCHLKSVCTSRPVYQLVHDWGNDLVIVTLHIKLLHREFLESFGYRPPIVLYYPNTKSWNWLEISRRGCGSFDISSRILGIVRSCYVILINNHEIDWKFLTKAAKVLICTENSWNRLAIDL